MYGTGKGIAQDLAAKCLENLPVIFQVVVLQQKTMMALILLLWSQPIREHFIDKLPLTIEDYVSV